MTYTYLPPDAEFRGLLAEHGSYGAVARALGCSKTAVADRCRRLGLPSPDRRGGRRTCSYCRVTSEDRVVLRFGLINTKVKTRYAGTISLCEPCWRQAIGRTPTRAAA